MRLFNKIFYITLFFGFFLPSNSSFYIPIPGTLLSINECAFLLLPIINRLCVSDNDIGFINFKLKRNILLLLIIVLFTEVVIKNLLFNHTLTDAYKTVRIGLPLFSSLILVFQGIRPNIKLVWKTLLFAISSSVLISFIEMVLPLPIHFNAEIGGNSINVITGRIFNSNSSFGFVGMYLLLTKSNRWYAQGKLVKFTAFLSVICLILTFNRTLLALLLLESIYLVKEQLSVKMIIKGLFFFFAFSFVFLITYNNNDEIRNQLDDRFFSILDGDKTIEASMFHENRDVIYYGILEKIDKGYFYLGLPYEIPIFTWPRRWSSDVERDLRVTDTSFITILLRYGIIPLFMIFFILKRMYSISHDRIYEIFFILLLIASLNIDTLTRQNSILFLVLLLFITKTKGNE